MTKLKKTPLKKQLQDNKLLILVSSVTAIVLLIASFGAQKGYLKTRKEGKPIPDSLIESLTPTPKTSNSEETKKCVITGCSNQICSDEKVVTTCEYKDIYSCYKTATCEVQDNGKCGWTMDEALSKCLQTYVGEPSL